MILILIIILEILFVFSIIFAFYKVISENIDENSFGRNHCGIVTFSSSGYDIHFDEMTDEEIYNRLKNDYYFFHHLNKPCYKNHLAEYRIITKNYKVKTIGWITKNKVVFEGKEYKFK